MKLNSLAFRLIATAMAWTVIALPIVGIIIFGLISNLIMEGFDSRLRQHAWLLQSEAISESGEPVRPTSSTEPLFGVTNSGWYWQIRPYKGGTGRRFVSDSLATGRLASPHEMRAPRKQGDMRWMDAKGPLGQSIRIVELIGTVSEKKDAAVYLFTVAGPLDWPQSTINHYGLVLALALALTGLALLVATFLQVKVALRPLSVIEKGLSDIRAGKAERLEGTFPAEIEPFQVELNALMESNVDIIERARTQVGNLAHALKTPLAVIVNEAARSNDTLATKVSEQARLMSHQITHYLDRARLASRVNTIGRSTPVRSVIEGLQRALERIHADKGVKITIAAPDGVSFRGEKQDFEELLGNLMDNAAKWANREVHITIEVLPEQSKRPGNWLSVRIDDDGPGVPVSKRAQILKRGQRLDETKPGTGLGLSIVRDLVTSYRGTLRFHESPLGGLQVELVLPAVGR